MKTSQHLAFNELGIADQERDFTGRLVVKSDGGKILSEHYHHPVAENPLPENFEDLMKLPKVKKVPKRNVDDSISKPKACEQCGKMLKDIPRYKRHLFSYHKSVKCKVCHLEFQGPHFRLNHMNRVHCVKVKCSLCSVSVKGQAKLRMHMINKHMLDHEKPFVCQQCGKGFAEKTKLKSHEINIHIKNRPYKCRVEGCLADFNALANRNAHEKTVHKYNFKEQMTQIRKMVSQMNTLQQQFDPKGSS